MQLYSTNQPESTLQQALQSSQQDQCFALCFPFEQYYLPEQPILELLAVIWPSPTGWQVWLTPATPQLIDRICALTPNPDAVQPLLDELDGAWFKPSQAWLLEPIAIAKPWGQEIWFTGIEARGQCGVQTNAGSLPLPWLLALAGQCLTGLSSQNLILLKILDPLPDPVYGDLYFELHEQKREVYVVTQIDQQAWPDGIGGIRFGFNQALRQTYAEDQAFKAAYLAAVQQYEQIRRQIDRQFDALRQQAGIDLNAPVAAAQLKLWQQQLPAELIAAEQEARQQMEAFSATLPLQIGDVVKVPCLTPHSLLHGVQTVEFQTPVYERKILSFAQKVLTQTHWDTEAALQLAELDPAQPESLAVLVEQPGLKIEPIVRFDDFEVQRIRLSAGHSLQLEQDGRYALLMLIQGQIDLATSGDGLKPGQAVLISALQDSRQFSAQADSLLLLALPVQEIPCAI